MELFFKDNTLFVNIEERINFSLINKLQKRLYRIIDSYSITNIVINILSNEYFDRSLLDDLVNDYKSKYSGLLIVK